MKTLFLSILCLIRIAAFAQPVLTASNSNFVAGDIFYRKACDTAGLNVGASGPDCTWNYLSLSTTHLDTVNVVPCSSTPYCDSFPAGSIAMQFATRSVNYVICNSDNQISVGNHSDDVGYSYFVRQDTSLKYPTSYLTTWNDTSLEIYDTTYASSHLFRSGYSIADGYGTLILPTGTFTGVLRLHNVVYLTDSNYTGGSLSVYYYRTDIYAWYLPGFHYPILMMNVDNDVVTGAIQDISYVVYSTGPAISKLSVTTNQCDNFNIYPNPAKDLLHITGANITGVELTDMTGKVLMTGTDGSTLLTSSLTNGLYILKIHTPSGITIKKIEVSR